MSFKNLSYIAKRGIFNVSEAVRKPIIRPHAFLDVKVGDHKPKRMLFELYADRCPVTVEEVGKILTGHGNLFLKGASFNRIIPDLYALTGDLPTKESISAKDFKLKDENYSFSHDQEGLLSLVNNGVGAKTSQLMITLGPVPWFDTKYVVFGKILEGLEVLNEIELCGSMTGDVKKKVSIYDCGQIIPKHTHHDAHHHDAHHH